MMSCKDLCRRALEKGVVYPNGDWTFPDSVLLHKLMKGYGGYTMYQVHEMMMQLLEEEPEWLAEEITINGETLDTNHWTFQQISADIFQEVLHMLFAVSSTTPAD